MGNWGGRRRDEDREERQGEEREVKRSAGTFISKSRKEQLT